VGSENQRRAPRITRRPWTAGPDYNLTSHPIHNIADLDAVLRAASASGTDSLFVIASRLTNVVAAKIAQYGREKRLPMIAPWREFVASGCLLSYGPNRIFESTRIAGYVEKVFRSST
jgi:putative tryptophan/tyrosine transport system substrate-binding protein